MFRSRSGLVYEVFFLPSPGSGIVIECAIAGMVLLYALSHHELTLVVDQIPQS